MIELKGKYSNAIIYTDYVEDSALRQIITLINHPMSKGAHIRVMPDVHYGSGCVIGFTARLGDKIVPNLIGVDIGCGVITLELNKKPDFSKLDKIIFKNVPLGTNIQPSALDIDSELEDKIYKVCKKTGQNFDYVKKSLGTLGGGNHFIEVEESKGKYFLTIHTGSRNFGKKICEFFQKRAQKLRKSVSREEIEEIKKKYKGKDIEKAIKEKIASRKVPSGLEYLENDEAKEYFECMKVAQEFANENRRRIGDIIIKKAHLEVVDSIESVHNYINFNDNIIRKGAISAHKGEKLVVPMNMIFGIVVGTGKGLKEWNFSAPHGAGRTKSRAKAKQSISLDRLKKQIREAGVYSSCINEHVLDEAPDAYKKPKEVLKFLTETVDIENIAKSRYVIKDASKAKAYKKRKTR